MMKGFTRSVENPEVKEWLVKSEVKDEDPESRLVKNEDYGPSEDDSEDEKIWKSSKKKNKKDKKHKKKKKDKLKGKQVHQCTTCKKFFTERHGLWKHQINVCGKIKEEGPWICKYIYNAETEDEYTCFKQYDTKHDLNKHKDIHKTYSEKLKEKFVCGHIMWFDKDLGKNILCVKEFKNKYNLSKHIEKGSNHSSDNKDPKSKTMAGEIWKCKFVMKTADENSGMVLCGRVFHEKWKYNIHKKKMS